MKFKIFVSAIFLLAANITMAELVVTDARIKAPIPGQTLSAGYFDLENTSSEVISVVGVGSDSASRVEMHTHVMENGMMSMLQMDSVELESGESLSFIEGGHHLMIFDPDHRTIVSGEFDLVFELGNGTQVEVIANVEQFLK